MKLNRRAGWNTEELETWGWGKTAPPVIYDTEDAVYSLTSDGGIEDQISSIRELIAAMLDNMPAEAAIATLNKLSDRDFVQEPNSDR